MNFAVIENLGDIIVLKLCRDLEGMASVKEFRAILTAMKCHHAKKILFDFHEIKMIHPDGIIVLLAFAKEFREKGGQLFVRQNTGTVRTFFSIFRINEIFTEVKDYSEFLHTGNPGDAGNWETEHAN